MGQGIHTGGGGEVRGQGKGEPGIQHCLQLSGNAGVGDNQHPTEGSLLKYGAQFRTAVEHLRLPVGKHRQSDPQYRLNSAAINGFDGIHKPS